DGLRRFVATFERGFGREVHVTDASGRDVLTGEDLSTQAIYTGRLSRGVGLMFVKRSVMLSKSSEDGKYRIYLPFGWSGEKLVVWWRPQLVFGALAVIVLCWALAHHLSRPVLQLQQVVERFGSGDTSVRARSQRSDEIGRLA